MHYSALLMRRYSDLACERASRLRVFVPGWLPVRIQRWHSLSFEGGPAAVQAVQAVHFQRPGGFNVLYTTIHTGSTLHTQKNRLERFTSAIKMKM